VATLPMRSPWTNPSVLALAGDKDPVDEIRRHAQALVLKARDAGWTGPPFDPIELARINGLALAGEASVQDARTTVGPDGRLRIEFNPTRPRARIRYSIAHELGHTLFPDCAVHVRHRGRYHTGASDEWQLETLCNVAAAEFLMPTGSFPELVDETQRHIDDLLRLRQEYGVSVEAILIRSVRQAAVPISMFCGSKIESSTGRETFRLEYSISSTKFRSPLHRGLLLPPESALSQISAIGFTAKFDETWFETPLHIEAVGLAPYPGSASPRIAGIATMAAQGAASMPSILYLYGDALAPAGNGVRIIGQVVNNATPNWGGRGFAQAVRSRFPKAQSDFQKWVQMDRRNLELGSARLVQVDDDLYVCSMVCQEGYGPRGVSRLRYSALQQCLISLGEYARRLGASLSMPRIGTGYAGGSWEIVSELVEQELCANGTSVTVYDLPLSTNSAPSAQLSRA
jgi:O-acetyl-ADP-ribose deacetylase (regulator of RNase III)